MQDKKVLKLKQIVCSVKNLEKTLNFSEICDSSFNNIQYSNVKVYVLLA